MKFFFVFLIFLIITSNAFGSSRRSKINKSIMTELTTQCKSDLSYSILRYDISRMTCDQIIDLSKQIEKEDRLKEFRGSVIFIICTLMCGLLSFRTAF